ncbi:GNAT family N-acetyltransferase [Streptococcus suis]|nr:GNAT family N-acetyltransferase [Streptococcus suis]NQJ76652.1 GNAT family N-acetyltransferase [Streptococcus suis]
MEIRFAQPVDLEEISRLEQANFSKEEQISEDVLKTYVNVFKGTSLVMEEGDEVVGVVLACPSILPTVTDDIFFVKNECQTEADYLAIASLSVAEAYKGQGIGTLLLAALKEVATYQGRKGIALTCKEYLVNYYEANQFEDMGHSQSQFGNQTWVDMLWLA